MTRYLTVFAFLTACAAEPETSRLTQAISTCPSNPPLRCQANLYSSDQFCTDACSEQIGGDAEAYCPEITPGEDAGCRLLCAGTPNVAPDYAWSACMNLCYSKIFHNCVGGRLP